MGAYLKSFVLLLSVFCLTAGLCVAEATAAEHPSDHPSEHPAPQIAAPEPPTQAAPSDDPDRVLATVGNESLTAWQADVMVDERAASDHIGAVDMWIDIKLRLAEVRKMNLDTDKKAGFIAQLFKEHYLAVRILDKELRNRMPEPTDDASRKYYQDNIKKYERPFRADVQHVQVLEQEEAQAVLTEAGQGGDFDKLVETYSKASDKSRKGLVRGPEASLKRAFPDRAIEAIKMAKEGAILGPFIGRGGFEILKIQKITPASTSPFEEVKSNINAELQRQAFQTAREEMLERLKTDIKVVTSPEITEAKAKMEAEQKARMEAGKQTPGSRTAPVPPPPPPAPAPKP